MDSYRKERELEAYFSRIQASFSKKFIVTAFDLLYIAIANLPIFVLIVYWNPNEGIIQAFHELVNRNNGNKLPAYRCLLFAIWIFFCLYGYFVVLPAKTEYQTFFSNVLKIKAISIEDTPSVTHGIKQSQLLRANFIPVLLLPMINIIFFALCTGFCNSDWHEKVFKNNGAQTNGQQITVKGYNIPLFSTLRALIAVAFFLQLYHLCTVGASKKALNWFVKSNGIIYVDEERLNIVRNTEGKPPIERNNLLFIDMPGVNEVAYETLKGSDSSYAKADFSESIDVSPVSSG